MGVTAMPAKGRGARAREVERKFYSDMRPMARKLGFNCIRNVYWKNEGAFIFSATMLLYLGRSPAIGVQTDVKTLRMGDVYWEVMGMGDNRCAPMSRRVTGVWAMRGDRTVLMPDGLGRPGDSRRPELRVPVRSEDDLVPEAERLLAEFVAAAHALLDSCGRDEGRFCGHLLEGLPDGFSRSIILASAGRLEEARRSAAKQSARWRPKNPWDEDNCARVVAWIDGREGEAARDGAL